MHLMILGGAGLIGRALIDHLAARGGKIDTTVVSRSVRDVPRARRALTGHFADLMRETAFRRHVATADAVVHLADGLSMLQQRQRACDGVEAGRLVAASERLVEAVRDARVPLFIYMSSIKAIGDEEDARVLVETSEPRCTTLYGQSKLRLEDSIARILQGSSTRCVILRTPVLISPTANGSMRRLLDYVDTPLPLPLAGLNNRRSLLSTHNLASALAVVLRSFRTGPGGIFHIHDGSPLSTTDIVTTLRQALGRPVRLFPPTRVGARTVRHVPALGPIARRLMGSLEVCDDHFRRSFDWQPWRDTRAALAEMAANHAAGHGRAWRAGFDMGKAA